MKKFMEYIKKLQTIDVKDLQKINYGELLNKLKQRLDLSINIILIIVWALTSRGYPWFLWPLCVWGVFVLAQYARVFVFKPMSDKNAVEKEAEKIRRDQG